MKILSQKSVVLALAFSLLAEPLRAQSMETNPTGPAGRFNGNSEVAGSMDPLTANVTRSIADISGVPGSVTSFGLVRTMNSRPIGFSNRVTYPFGKAGAWRHNFQWEMDSRSFDHPEDQPPPVPSQYTITYPQWTTGRFLCRFQPGPKFARSLFPKPQLWDCRAF